MCDRYELIVVGGGPAGLAAACEAYRCGLRNILVIDRDRELGGILNQCIHNGFGLHYFQEQLTGPEYAQRFVSRLRDTSAQVLLDTMVLEVTQDRRVHILNKSQGYHILQADSIVLAMGCRERTRGAVAIPGSRPAGVLTAGTAQRYVNMEGFLVGRRVVVLGSGDIGLIMARRMVLEGARVLACVEIMPYSGGLSRNIVQCLQDYDIPLYLSHTIVDVRGTARLEQVVVAEVDSARNPISGTEFTLDCDTLLLSVGLIPENELSRRAGIRIDARTGGAVVCENMETSLPGIFACGNAVHVHDLVDYVTAESIRAGRAAAESVLGRGGKACRCLTLEAGGGVNYTVPQRIRCGAAEQPVEVFFRAGRVYGRCRVIVSAGSRELASYQRARMTPGEMECVSLPGNLRELAGEEVVTIRVEEESVQ